MPPKKKEERKDEPEYVYDSAAFVYETVDVPLRGQSRKSSWRVGLVEGGSAHNGGDEHTTTAAEMTVLPAPVAFYKGEYRGKVSPGTGSSSISATSPGAAGTASPAAAATSSTSGSTAAALATADVVSAAAGNVMRHGVGEYRDAHILYTGQWSEDTMHGKGKLVFLQDGACYSGDFQHNHFDGHGVYLWASGASYTGFWRGSRMHGDGVYIDEAGVAWRGKYYNGTGPGLQRLTPVTP